MKMKVKKTQRVKVITQKTAKTRSASAEARLVQYFFPIKVALGFACDSALDIAQERYKG